jgi:hypothetical protein
MKVYKRLFFFSLTFSITLGCYNDQKLKQNMTMSEVETLFGKPDKTITEKGKIENDYETPTVIVWFYKKYPIKTSDASYNKPSFINFVPDRFIASENKINLADSLAWDLNEQSNSYRVASFVGSIPADTNDKKWIGGNMGFIPSREIKKK